MQQVTDVRRTLEAIGAIDGNRVIRIADRTRDRDVPVWTDPVTGVIFIDDFYIGDDVYEVGEYRDAEVPSGFEEEADARRRLRDFEQFIFGHDVLEFGCGRGLFLRRAHSFAKRVAGVELQKSFRRDLNASGITCVSELSEVPFNPDVAFMFHVLEHLPSPLLTLKQLRESLDEGGMLIAEVPHARDFLIGQASCSDFLRFTLWSQHLILHTRDSLTRLLAAAGFSQIQIVGVQRYPLSNHMSWLVDGRPGGHRGRFSALETRELSSAYSHALARADASDTLVAIAM